MQNLVPGAQQFLKAGLERGFTIIYPEHQPGLIRTAEGDFPAETYKPVLDDLWIKGLVDMKSSTFYTLTLRAISLVDIVETEE